MPSLKDRMAAAVGRTGNSLGAMAGALRERMYAANAKGELEKAKAAHALYKDYTFEAMRLGRIEIAAINQSQAMKDAVAALKAVNKDLTTEKKRVADLTKKIDGVAALIGKVESTVDKIGKLAQKKART